MITRTYNIQNLFVNWGGIIFTGFGDSAVEVSKAEDTWTTKVGADGVVVRSLVQNKLGMAKVVLSAASPVNDLISARAALDVATGLPIYHPSFQLGYFGSSMLVVASACWLRKDPVVAYGKDIGDLEYTFDLNPVEQFTGGLVL